MGLVVYGIPSCGTVKKARAWLDREGHTHTFVDLRLTPPDAARVRAWVAAFGVAAMKNTSGGSYRALPDEKASWNEAEWAARFVADPMLIKRPIIERAGAPLTVGFRDERALAALLA